jgi:hypothetical protein
MNDAGVDHKFTSSFDAALAVKDLAGTGATNRSRN